MTNKFINNLKKNFFFICLFIFIFTIHQIFLQSNLILKNTYVAEDLKFFIPNLIFGKIWYLKNTLKDIPHFAPHLCGGTPYYADPQSIYYSFIQFFFIFFNVPTALHLTFAVLSIIAYFGMFLFLKISFQCDKYSSLIGATLFLFNGYFINRALVGHLSLCYLVFIPLYCFIICESTKLNNKHFKNIYIILSSFILSSFFFVGAGAFIIITFYTITIVMLLYVLIKKNTKIFFPLIISFGLCLLLSLSKIIYSIYFLKNFPRI